MGRSHGLPFMPLSDGLRSFEARPYGFLEPTYHCIDLIMKQMSLDRSELKLKNPSLLRSLQSVSISGPARDSYGALHRNRYVGEDRLSIKSILPYLQVKFTGKVRFQSLWDEGITRFNSPELVFEIVDLGILDSFLSAESLRQFLSCFHCLTSFQYKNLEVGRVGSNLLFLRDIWAGLKNSNSTLKRLAVSDDWNTAYTPWLPLPDNDIRSFCEFSRLRYDLPLLNAENSQKIGKST
jgi:hypothetical protein